LVRAADVGRDDPKDNAVIRLSACGIDEFGKGDCLYLDLPGADINYSTIA
jgi:hypothetical protein